MFLQPIYEKISRRKPEIKRKNFLRIERGSQLKNLGWNRVVYGFYAGELLKADIKYDTMVSEKTDTTTLFLDNMVVSAKIIL